MGTAVGNPFLPLSDTCAAGKVAVAAEERKVKAYSHLVQCLSVAVQRAMQQPHLAHALALVCHLKYTFILFYSLYYYYY